MSCSELAEAMVAAWEEGDVPSFHQLSAQLESTLWGEKQRKKRYGMASLLAVILISYLILDLSDGSLGTIDLTVVPSFVWLISAGGFALVRQVYF